jgi:hypothetical protein
MKNIAWTFLLPALVSLAMGADDPECDQPAWLIEPVDRVEEIVSRSVPKSEPASSDAARETKPENCVIKTFGLTPFGNPDIGLNNPQQVIVINSATGEGKIYKPDLFGNADTLSSPLGEVRRASSDSLAVHTYDKFGLLDILNPRQFIDIERTGNERTGKGLIYAVDAFGLKQSLTPTGAVTVECE